MKTTGYFKFNQLLHYAAHIFCNSNEDLKINKFVSCTTPNSIPWFFHTCKPVGNCNEQLSYDIVILHHCLSTSSGMFSKIVSVLLKFNFVRSKKLTMNQRDEQDIWSLIWCGLRQCGSKMTLYQKRHLKFIQSNWELD